jgi:hypothetical protein
VRDLAAVERAAGYETTAPYSSFSSKVEETKRGILDFLIHAKREGKSVVGYGAPGKGNTLLKATPTVKEVSSAAKASLTSARKTEPGIREDANAVQVPSFGALRQRPRVSHRDLRRLRESDGRFLEQARLHALP